MQPSKPPAAALPLARVSSRRKQRKGNGHTELSRKELERMLLDAASLRAGNARETAERAPLPAQPPREICVPAYSYV